jgi:hypothetical protein
MMATALFELTWYASHVIHNWCYVRRSTFAALPGASRT